jgi:hypothetical protein
VPQGEYALELADVQVLEDALRPIYLVLEGEHEGVRFTGMRLNMTPRGVRRFSRAVRAWGVQPRPESTLDDIAAALKGRRARALVELREFKGQQMNDIDLRTIRLAETNANVKEVEPF